MGYLTYLIQDRTVQLGWEAHSPPVALVRNAVNSLPWRFRDRKY